MSSSPDTRIENDRAEHVRARGRAEMLRSEVARDAARAKAAEVRSFRSSLEAPAGVRTARGAPRIDARAIGPKQLAAGDRGSFSPRPGGIAIVPSSPSSGGVSEHARRVGAGAATALVAPLAPAPPARSVPAIAAARAEALAVVERNAALAAPGSPDRADRADRARAARRDESIDDARSSHDSDAASAAAAAPPWPAWMPRVLTDLPRPPPALLGAPTLERIIEFAELTRTAHGAHVFTIGLCGATLAGMTICVTTRGKRRIELRLRGAERLADSELQSLVEALRSRDIDVVDVVRESTRAAYPTA